MAYTRQSLSPQDQDYFSAVISSESEELKDGRALCFVLPVLFVCCVATKE